MTGKPPPVLGNARVIEYAVIDESVTYSGRGSLFVGTGEGNLKELGPVPCLAIGEEPTGEIMLLHCDEGWDVLARSGKYASVSQARASAERRYQGVSSRWVDAGVTPEEASRFRDAMWADQRCSFCGKTPLEVQRMIARDDVRICDSCVAGFRRMLAEDSPPEK